MPQYFTKYSSPLGKILLTADNEGLTGLWLETQSHDEIDNHIENPDFSVLQEARKWLDIYFSGGVPKVKIPLHFTGTDFQNQVWRILSQIPYGRTTTYGEIAKQIAENRHLAKMSAQAVGGAVGRNKISIIVPCHRVLGVNDKLTGYTGGLDKKIALLQLEKILV